MGLTLSRIRLGDRTVMVSAPNVRQYGHLALEILMTLGDAKDEGADVFFVYPRGIPGEALFELESPDVRVLHPNAIGLRLLRSRIAIQELSNRFDKWREEFGERWSREWRREISTYVADERIPVSVRVSLRGIRQDRDGALKALGAERAERPSYFRRALLRRRLPIRLRPAAAAAVEAQARAAGIPLDAPLVCLHARESGYKAGQEMQDTKPQSGRDDRARNARIESYLAAADLLRDKGYTLVRVGDPSMTPVRHPGVVDLATHPGRTNLLEIYCALRSDFMIAGESGLQGVVYLTNTPLLTVNATEPISAYPIRAPGLFMTKAVIDKRLGRRLSERELLTEEYQRHLRNTRRYVYIDNTPDEIVAGVEEMLLYLKGEWVESAAQNEYHAAIMAAAADLKSRLVYVRKWGLDGDFLGDGRMARVCAERQ